MRTIEADANASAAEPSEHGALGQALWVERQVKLPLAELAAQLAPLLALLHPLLADPQHLVDRFVAFQQCRGSAVDDPGQPTIGPQSLDIDGQRQCGQAISNGT